MNAAILLSGGIGTRIRLDIPKQYIRADGMMIVTRTLMSLLENAYIDQVRIVADKNWQQAIMDEQKADTDKISGFSQPGANRQLSIYNALCDLKAICKADDIVIIQDAVRPMASQELISGCITHMPGYDGVLPVLPMKDTVYLCDRNGSVSERNDDAHTVTGLIDRDSVYAGQAPEAYRFGLYLAANEALLPDRIIEINGAAEPAVLAGMNITTIPGEETNIKITTPEDLRRYIQSVGS